MIPLSTTTITVQRIATDSTRDGYDPLPAPMTPSIGVRAHFSSPSGSESRAGGSRQASRARLLTDTVDLRHTDRVLDETTGKVWTVATVLQRAGVGLDYTVAVVELVTGAT